MKISSMITQARLKELLHYDPLTGVFNWKVSRGKRKAGAVAGCVCGHGYIEIKVDTVLYKSHRLAFLFMTGSIPIEVDHVNGIRTDNKWVNIRSCTTGENKQNLGGAKSNSKTGLLGSSFHKSSGKYRAAICINRVITELGYFATPELAHEAYLKAKAKLHTHNERMVE